MGIDPYSSLFVSHTLICNVISVLSFINTSTKIFNSRLFVGDLEVDLAILCYHVNCYVVVVVVVLLLFIIIFYPR